MKNTIYAIALLSLVGFLYFKLHKGGRWNPHLVTITEANIAERATTEWRFCNFDPPAPIEVGRHEWLKIVTPVSERVLKFPAATTVVHLYLPCRTNEVKTDEVAMPYQDNEKIQTFSKEQDTLNLEITEREKEIWALKERRKFVEEQLAELRKRKIVELCVEGDEGQCEEPETKDAEPFINKFLRKE